MAYDKEEYERIDKMELGDLVQYMITHYDPRITENYGPEAHNQSNNYFHAYERLNFIHEQVRIGFMK